MNANKILSASLIDVIFDGRNKAYGAYDLRKTYPKREKKALAITISVVAIILCGVTLANSPEKNKTKYKISPDVVLANIPPDEKKPEKLPEPEKPPKPEQPVKTIQVTPPVITPDNLADHPLPDVASMDSAKIDVKTVDGKPYDGTPDGPSKDPVDGNGFIETKKKVEDPGPVEIVEVPAKFIGNWEKFLLKNLNPETPVEHNAPEGRYSVVIQFVVDKEGNVSDIKPLTNHGYGLEEEAVRVLKKATKWEPAIQNGYKVKAYHRQIITFEVNGEQ